MRGKRSWTHSVLAGCLFLVLGLLCSRPAQAQRYYGQLKPGPFMFNLKLGAAIGIAGERAVRPTLFTTQDQFTLVLDFGFAVDRDRNAYLLFPLQFQVNSTYSMVMIPFGFQYDIPITPVRGLYLYPRISIGYTAFVDRLGGGGTTSFGVIMPEFGAKYVFPQLKGRLNVGFEPFGLPIFFRDNVVLLNYRLLWYAGVNF